MGLYFDLGVRVDTFWFQCSVEVGQVASICRFLNIPLPVNTFTTADTSEDDDEWAHPGLALAWFPDVWDLPYTASVGVERRN